MSINHKVTRRRLLEITNSTMLLYPLMRVLENSEAKAATNLTPRAIFVHFSCGAYPEFWPGGGTGPLGGLSPILAPLEPHKSDLLLFKGICTRGDTNHHAAPAQVLAGWGKKGGGQFPGGATSTEVPYSLDQMLADKWGDKTLKKSINLGSGTSSPVQLNAISYNKSGAALTSQDNPQAAFSSIFGNFSLTNGGSGALKLASENVASGRKRIIDYLLGDVKKIAGSLGDMERKQFEAHVTSLDDLAKEIAKSEPMNPGPGPGGPTGPGGGNPPPTQGNGVPPRSPQCNPDGPKGIIPADGNQLQAVMQANTQIMLQALACGITRVGVMVFCVSDTTLDYGNGGPYHLDSHGDRPGLAAAQTGFMQNVAALAAGMKAVKIGDHSLFDESLIMCATDQGDDPNAHDGVNIASFLLGNLGGRLKGGRMIAWPFAPRDWSSITNGMDYNRLLVSFAHLVGETGINEVGNTAFTGPIPEIIG